MKKHIVALVALGLSTGFTATLDAAQSLQELRQHVEGLRKQERELTKQRDAVHRERKVAEYELVLLENQDTLSDAIASLSARRPRSRALC